MNDRTNGDRIDRALTELREARELILEYDAERDAGGHVWDALRSCIDRRMLAGLSELEVCVSTSRIC